MLNKFYSVKEFAKILGLCDRTIRICIKNGTIRALKLSPGKKAHYRIHCTEVERIYAKGILDICENIKKEDK